MYHMRQSDSRRHINTQHCSITQSIVVFLKLSFYKTPLKGLQWTQSMICIGSQISRAVRVWISTILFLFYNTVHYRRRFQTSGKKLKMQSSGLEIEARIQTVFLTWEWNTWKKSYLDYLNCTRCYTPLGKQSLTDLVRNWVLTQQQQHRKKKKICSYASMK